MLRCGVKSCKTNCATDPHVSFYSFPKNKKLRDDWIKNIGEGNLSPGYTHICSTHFEDKWTIKNNNRIRLKDDAVPNKFLITKIKSIEQTTEMRCCVPLCRNDSESVSKTRDITFHKFPKQTEVRQYWVNALGLEGWRGSDERVAESMVCSEHFSSDDLYATQSGYRKLRVGAVPLLMQDALENDDNETMHDVLEQEESFEYEANEKADTVQICRICLQTDCRLFAMKQYRLTEVYKNLTGFAMVEDGRLSQTFCSQCAQRLLSYDRFRERSLRADLLLTDLLKKTEASLNDQIKKINRENFQLSSNLVEKVFPYDHFDLYIQEDDEMYQEVVNLDDNKKNDINVEVGKENNDNQESESANLDTVNIKNEYQPEDYEKETYIVNEIEDGKDFEMIQIKHDLNETQITQVPVIYDMVIDDKFKIVKREDLVNMIPKFKFNQRSIDGIVAREDLEVYSDDQSDFEVKYKKLDNCNSNRSIFETDVNETEVTTTDMIDDNENVINEDTNDRNDNWNNDSCEADWGNDKDNESDGDKKRKNINKTRQMSHVKKPSFADDVNDVIFTMTKLTYEEKVAELEKRLLFYKDASYSCKLCFRGYSDSGAHFRHMAKHTSEHGAFECDICKYRFRDAKLLEKHQAMRHSTRFTCNICEFTTTYTEPARQHGQKHRGIMYQCPYCSEEFLRYTVCMDHITINHAQENICSVCGQKFANAEELEEHRDVKHSDHDENLDSGPRCLKCEMQFASERAYAQHLSLSVKHNDEFIQKHLQAKKNQKDVMIKSENCPKWKSKQQITGPIECEQCGEQLETLRQYHAHFRRAHPDKTRTYYPTMTSKIMCELCGKFFKAHCHYAEHLRTHNNEKPYSCEHCGKAFGKKHHLKNHRNVHSAVRRIFKCKLCDKEFANQSNLHRHKTFHTGEKRYKCSLCGRRYRSKGEKQSHYDHVHLRKPWPKRSRPKRPAPPEVNKKKRKSESSSDDESGRVIEEGVEEMETEY